MKRTDMAKGRTLSAIVTICFTLLFLVFAAAPAEAGPYSAIVVDADTGRVLHAQDADAPRYPASLTKMMTLYMAFDALKEGRLKMDQRLTVSQHAAAQPYGIALRAGQTITVRDAILASITKSANNAATVLGEAIGGSEKQFAAMMTRRAQQLGMHNTVFQNASGLPNTKQKSTARDMATLGIALIKNHKPYYTYFSTAQFEWQDQPIRNHNHMLTRYEGADGIKTGFIAASGFNLVASAKRDGRRIVAVVYGGTSVVARDNRMIQLLDIGFEKIENGADSNAPLMVEGPKPNHGLGLISSAEAATPAPTSAKARQIKKATKAAAPAANPPAGEWAVQLGAFKQAAAAEKLLDRVRNKAPEAEPLVDAVDAGKVTLYRARLTGLTQTAARQTCEQLKREKMTCSVVSPDA
ncbi:D-alanyl-D-alanine carboxypeptidase [Ferrovibrio terrae]|uniref:D-alanyl-D-alanine carboxypeptidase n=1 Tax=Ferrovibrio terrae TaxID=2594003 RepID=UPI0031382693